LFSQRSLPDGKENKMKVVIRYETERVTFNLSDEEAKQMGCCVNIDLESIPEDERQSKLQEACDEQFNRPDYNNWHKYWRHQGDSKAQPDDEGEELESSEPLMSEVADDRIFRKDEIKRDNRESYDAVCQWIRKILKPEVAEAFIATKIDGVTIRDYVTETAKPGDDIAKLENNLSKKLTRAAEKLAVAYPERSF
jgi:hypothetical protein